MSILMACRVPVVPLSRRSILCLTAGSVTAFLPPRLALARPSVFEDVPAAAAPDLSGTVLIDLDGEPSRLDAWRGRPVVLHLFATWCEPCRDELPRLLQAAATVPDAALCVVSLAEPPGRVRRFLETLGLDWPVLIDADRSASRRLGLATLPSTWILGPDLVPRFMAVGDVDWSAPEVRGWLAAVTRSHHGPALDRPFAGDDHG